jgi:hypothetical protein
MSHLQAVRTQATGQLREQVELELSERRIRFALQIQRYLVMAGFFMPIIMVGVWLFYVENYQLLLLAVNATLLISWALIPILYRRGRGTTGVYIGLFSLWLAAANCPLLLPEMLTVSAIGFVILMMLGKLLLGDRASRRLEVASIVAFTADVVLVSTVAPDWFPPLNPTAVTASNVAICVVAISVAALIVRLTVTGQENDYRRAQLASYELEQQAVTEQQQREQLEAAAAEIEQRMATEQQQRQALEALMQQLRAVARTLNGSATEILAASNQQVASAVEQESAITQTVATVEEVRTTVAQTAERANQVAAASRESVEISRTGQEAVTSTVMGMTTIQQRVANIAHTILALSERTQQIGEIIETVNALADQSKLLALNASIEAARAGEEGRGFAVVALEVRQLAEQSREATARVHSILSEIQNATNSAVMVTEEGSKGAASGMTLVEQAGAAIAELAATLDVAAQAATQIAASTHQQSNGMAQLAAAMGQIKQASAQAAVSARQTEVSVRDLLDMARDLEQTAERYDHHA